MRTDLESLARDTQAALGANLVALVLGGGYGRSEGAVVRVDGIERAYNDLDLFVVVQNKSDAALGNLAELSRAYEKVFGVHVDFARPVSIGDVRRWPRWLMWADAVNGHEVLCGPADVFASNAPAHLRLPLPAIEGLKLLLNRGAGLLMAMRMQAGVGAAHDADFPRRNYQKCALALGDALLMAYGRYTTPYRGRDAAFADLCAARPEVASLDIADLYARALEFKFAPDDVGRAQPDAAALRGLAGTWCKVVLAVESKRTGRRWNTIEDYAAWTGIREKDEHALAKVARNVVRNVRYGAIGWKHPREGLYRALPALLRADKVPNAEWAAEGARFLD
ncbi:MAG: hypothetical protein FJY92_04995, partial [Candidatus Hydrogenedentes bacterium]|nr:hypothetical protein [Candidatus Hydrogenedentota bacterium]